MKAVCYLRISTEGQAEGMGLDVQRQTVQRWCDQNGYEIVGIFHDETSGTNGLEHRLGLAQALAKMPDEADTLVIPRLDRLARDLVLSEQLLNEVWASGGNVVSCAQGEGDLRNDPEDPSRALIRQVLGAVSAYKRAMIVLRMKRGRMAKAAAGGFATGSPPFGWESDGEGGLREVASQQAAIRDIIKMREQGSSLQKIADELNNRGEPTKRKGGKWYPATVNAVVRRERKRLDQQA